MATWRTLIKDWLLRRDIILSRPPGQFNIMDIKLRKLQKRGLDVRMAIDGGAADGGWARELRKVFPAAEILCIEPREEMQCILAETARELTNVHTAKMLLGKTTGTQEFFQLGDNSSMLPGATHGKFGTVVLEPVDTLDNLLARMQLTSPDYIKLDLQGAELIALQGAIQTLKTASAVQLEVNFIPFQDQGALVGDVVAFMRDHGYRICEIFALWTRPLDGALAQGDVLFLREGHPLFGDKRWSPDASWT